MTRGKKTKTKQRSLSDVAVSVADSERFSPRGLCGWSLISCVLVWPVLCFSARGRRCRCQACYSGGQDV